MTHPVRNIGKRGRWAGLVALGTLLVLVVTVYQRSEDEAGLVSVAPGEGIAEFVEPGFPFIVTTLDAREIGPGVAADNVTSRGVVLLLGDDTYVAFDPDLLRMAVGWRGAFLEMVTMAQISYRDPGNKDNLLPRVLGDPVFSTGIYPGWQGGTPAFTDPRPPGPNPDDVGRGPLPSDLGRWEGIHLAGESAVLSYTVRGTRILEEPSSITEGGDVAIARTFRIDESEEELTLVVAEIERSAAIEGNVAAIPHAGDSLTLVGVSGAPATARMQVVDDRFLTLRLPAGLSRELFRVVLWRGPSERRDVFPALLEQPVRMAEPGQRRARYWSEAVLTRGSVPPDTAAYVVDRVTLPLDNPWRRNVRVADISFFSDAGQAAVVTFEGDVWIVNGLDEELERLEWRRFASGLYEPLGIEVVDDQIYVHSKEGIVRLHDRNGTGEADFYESFSNLAAQSIESREFPLGIEARPEGGFYLSRGSALDMGPATSDPIMPGFRAGSRHSGSILEVSADGRTLERFATGLRQPFVGLHPQAGTVSASDQEGNYVPATPVYLVPRGGYHGVPATAHREQVPAETLPIVWIPHQVDPSGSGHIWVTDERMGFGGEALIHLSYGRPGAFRVFVDSTASRPQGAVVPLLKEFPAPLLNGTVGPHDGHLYLAGFQVWGSRASEETALVRVRHTDVSSSLPLDVRAGAQGVVLRFAEPLDPSASRDLSRYDVHQWNYRRSESYGSGHFMLDGTPGQERLIVAGAHLSEDRTALLLVIPEMREVMQMEVGYSLPRENGEAVHDTVYLTVHAVARLDLASEGFRGVDWSGDMAAAGAAPGPESPALQPASPERGAELFQRIGCIACHSTDGSTAGKLGPTVLGLYGTPRTFTDGSTRVADELYLRDAILQPSQQTVEGYPQGMPTYLGVLDESEIESLILYIRALPSGSSAAAVPAPRTAVNPPREGSV